MKKREPKRERLKPCPFCGGRAGIRKIMSVNAWIVCLRCHVTTGNEVSEHVARAAWNRRA
jgi:Lar family restriction alleviation protein